MNKQVDELLIQYEKTEEKIMSGIPLNRKERAVRARVHEIEGSLKLQDMKVTLDNLIVVDPRAWVLKEYISNPEGKLVFVDFTKKKVVSESEWMSYAIKTALKAG